VKSKLLGSLYRCAKFEIGNLVFEDMRVSMLCEFGL